MRGFSGFLTVFTQNRYYPGVWTLIILILISIIMIIRFVELASYIKLQRRGTVILLWVMKKSVVKLLQEWRRLCHCCRMHLNGSLRESLVTSHIDNPVALAYDWIHHNLYWADVGLHSSRARIEVLTLFSRWRRMLHDDSVVRSPSVMVVDPRPEQGYCNSSIIAP